MSESPDLRDWIGRTETTESLVTAWQSDALAASLDRGDPPLADGDPIPPGWHWLYFPDVVAMADTGHDGHPRLGGFMPPVTLPRRMWAGNRMRFDAPLRVGDRLRRVSTIADVREKSGRRGALCFVTVRHALYARETLCTVEEHDVVYREAPAPDERPADPPEAPAGATWSREVDPGAVLLFRFSALTFNSHRIHYDREFCAEEGYPGLLVHGPLTMVLLVDLLRRSVPDATLSAFEVRATAPLYGGQPFTVHGRPGDETGAATLWACTPEGGLAMQGAGRY